MAGDITLEIKGLDRIIKNFSKSSGIVREYTSKAIRSAELFLKDTARKEVPFKTGRLQKSIQVLSQTQPFSGGITATAKYAAAVEFGSSPHKITAKGGGLSDGKTFFGKSVMHPGTKANPFMQRTADSKKELVERIFTDAAEKIANELTK